MSNANITTKNSAMSAFDNIKAGLEQAIEFQRNTLAGKPNTAKVHRMPELDVKTVREQTGFTQAKFAQTFAISLGTLRHWERGDRKPSGTALVLLHAVNKQPKTVMKLLGAVQ
jgi:putative transcriptional regulator